MAVVMYGLMMLCGAACFIGGILALPSRGQEQVLPTWSLPLFAAGVVASVVIGAAFDD